MARLSINLDTENDAFADDAIGETVRILNGIIHDLVINQPDYAKKIYDINGNNCGSWQWFAPEEDLLTDEDDEPSKSCEHGIDIYENCEDCGGICDNCGDELMGEFVDDVFELHGCERCDDATAAINQRIQDGSDSESSLRDRYDIYTSCAPEPHKSFDEWLDS